MPDTDDWLFDIIWDISDKAEAAGLPDVALKLEEAMDTYLKERRSDISGPVQFFSQRKIRVPRRSFGQGRRRSQANRMLNNIYASEKVTNGSKPGQANEPEKLNIKVSNRQSSLRFEWPL